jgi:hypothetical protein
MKISHGLQVVGRDVIYLPLMAHLALDLVDTQEIFTC